MIKAPKPAPRHTFKSKALGIVIITALTTFVALMVIDVVLVFIYLSGRI